MSGKHFIDKKPESILDWVAIVCAGIAFYLLLNNLEYFNSLAWKNRTMGSKM